MTDIEAITLLTAEYCHRLDNSQSSEVAALFADDGAIMIGRHVMEGHSRIERWAAEVRAGLETPTRHFCTNHEIDIDGDTAQGVVDWMAIGPGGSPLLLGRFTDAYRRDSEGWRIVKREVSFFRE